MCVQYVRYVWLFVCVYIYNVCYCMYNVFVYNVYMYNVYMYNVFMYNVFYV